MIAEGQQGGRHKVDARGKEGSIPVGRESPYSSKLRVANDTEYGLSSAVFTRDEARGLRFALGIEAGMTHVNDSSVDDTPTGPFGGEKTAALAGSAVIGSSRSLQPTTES